MTDTSSRPWSLVYLAIASTTMATLILELALTRIFSVVLYYHFAFMAISIALFGLGAGAIFPYYLGARRADSEVWGRLGWWSTLNVLTTAVMLLVSLHPLVSSHLTPLSLVILYFVSAIPFFVAGTVISLAIAEVIERVDRAYFFDLLGASAGCLLLVPLLNITGGPNTVLAAGAVYGVGGALWHLAGKSQRRAWISLGLAGLTAVFVVFNTRSPLVDVRFAKGQRLDRELFSRWNSFSRVAVEADDGAGNPAIVIDGDAETSIATVFPEQLPADGRAALLRNGPGLPYVIRPGAKTLVIGPGGGYDVIRALSSGSRNITGVEINPIIVNEVMRGRYAARSHNLYFRPEVRIQIEDGRSYVRRSPEKYQVIQMTLVDTWAATAAGAFALAENNLYTSDAFVDYLEHLQDDGLLAITRWEFDPPRESLRVVSLGLDALRRLGAPEPWRHFVIGREDAKDLTGYGARDTVIVKRTPFAPGEIARARQAIAASGMIAVYLPDEQIPNPFTGLLRSADPARFVREYRYDVSPVTDDRPFFFYTVRTRDLVSYITAGPGTEDTKTNIGVMLLLVLLGTSLAATAVILLLPPLLLRTKVPRETPVFLNLAYFFAIGIGFIMIEMSLVQKFVLFLGKPTYSLTVVVFSLLLSSGIGSYASRRLIGDDDRRLGLALALVAVVVSVLATIVPFVLRAEVALPVAAKCALTTALLFPAGFVMGMPFPCGLKRLEKRYSSAIRWAWALNSASSVLGSVAAIFFAIHLGLAETLYLGGATYLLALVVVIFTAKSQTAEAAVAVPSPEIASLACSGSAD